jgi:hypothetical protein
LPLASSDVLAARLRELYCVNPTLLAARRLKLRAPEHVSNPTSYSISIAPAIPYNEVFWRVGESRFIGWQHSHTLE